MTIPVSYVMTIYRGDSAVWQFQLWDADESPHDLTGVTPAAEIRDKPGGSRVTPITCSVTLPNIVNATLSAATSATLRAGQQVWDLQLTYPDATVATVISGPVIVTADVTGST